MTIEMLRRICRSLPGASEDVKWGQDLAFCVGQKMFAVVNLERPHQISFKCTAESFGELVERPGLIPAPYLARAMWVQEEALGETLERRELEALIRTSYELVKATLPRRLRDAAAAKAPARPRRSKEATRSKSRR